MAENTGQDIEMFNEFYSIFIEQSPNAIAMFDTQMRYIACSYKWRVDYGLVGVELINKSHYDIFPEIGEDWKTIHQDCLKGTTHVCDDATFTRSNGSQQWISWNIRPWVLRDQKIGGLIMFTQDITERKMLDEKLRISEESFRGAFEYAAIGMAIVSTSGQWLRINNSLSRMLGYTAAELMALNFQDITHPEDLNKDLRLLNELIAGARESYEMEKRYFHKNGTLVWAILAVSLVRDINGNPLHFISQITDITRIKSAEIEINSVLELTNEQNSKLLNFAYIVSHNLRSHSGNLSMLLNFIESDTEIASSEQELFRMLRDASLNLQQTIEHLNEVVSLNSGINQNMIAVNLHKAINGTIGNVEGLLKDAGVICINDSDQQMLIKVVPAYLDSILINFLTNAIKYRSRDKEGMIIFDTREEDKFYVLKVADNGLGIDLALNGDKLFGMYKTFHDHKDARGIGLFITRNQVEAMGGRVTVESEVNKGTTFSIYFRKG